MRIERDFLPRKEVIYDRYETVHGAEDFAECVKPPLQTVEVRRNDLRCYVKLSSTLGGVDLSHDFPAVEFRCKPVLRHCP